MISIRQHKIAQAAFNCITLREEAYQNTSKENDKPSFEKKKYGALAHKLPMLIMQNGMTQATGFLIAKNSKKTNEHLMLLDDLSQIILMGLGVSPPSETEDESEAEVEIGKVGKELHEYILTTDIQALTRITCIALDASGALRRYVQGVMHIDATGEEQENQPEKEN